MFYFQYIRHAETERGEKMSKLRSFCPGCGFAHLCGFGPLKMFDGLFLSVLNRFFLAAVSVVCPYGRPSVCMSVIVRPRTQFAHTIFKQEILLLNFYLKNRFYICCLALFMDNSSMFKKKLTLSYNQIMSGNPE